MVPRAAGMYAVLLVLAPAASVVRARYKQQWNGTAQQLVRHRALLVMKNISQKRNSKKRMITSMLYRSRMHIHKVLGSTRRLRLGAAHRGVFQATMSGSTPLSAETVVQTWTTSNARSHNSKFLVAIIRALEAL